MKKFFIVTLVVLAILTFLAVGGGVVYYYFFMKKTSVEEILPAGPIVYLKTNDLARLTDEFQMTKFWQTVSQVNVERLMAESGAPSGWTQRYKAMQKVLSSKGFEMFLEKFVGTEAAVAVYPPDIRSFDQRAALDIASNIYLITKLEPEAKMIEFVLGFFKEGLGDVEITQEKYGNYRLSRITLPDKGGLKAEVVYTRIQDYFVLGLGDKAVKSCIDVLTRKKMALAQDKDFLAGKAKTLVEPDTLVYLDLEDILKNIRDQVVKLVEQNMVNPQFTKEAMTKILSSMVGLEQFILSAQYGALATFKMDLLYDPKRVGPQFVPATCDARRNSSIVMVPKDVLWYQWTRCNDFKEYWRQIKYEMEKDSLASADAELDNLPRGIEGFESMFGLSIEDDIIDSLGDEMGWFLAKLDLSGIFPIPSGVFFLEVTDVAKAKEVLEKLTDQQFIMLQAAEYQGVPIKYVSLPLGIEVEPAYCFLGEYLLFTSNRKLLERAIDSSKDPGKSLVFNPDAKDTGLTLHEEVNGVFFVDLKHVAAKISSMVSWLSDWGLSQYKRKQAYKDGIRKRLEDLQGDVQMAYRKLESSQERLETFIAQRTAMGAESEGVDDLDAKINVVKMQIEDRKQDLALAQQRVSEQQQIVEGFSKEEDLDVNLINLYINELVDPLFKGVESFKAVSSKVIFKEGDVETVVTIKTE